MSSGFQIRLELWDSFLSSSFMLVIRIEGSWVAGDIYCVRPMEIGGSQRNGGCVPNFDM